MNIYITKHAIKRFYERFPQLWKKYKCIDENWANTQTRDPHNIHVLNTLLKQSQEIKHINNHHGYLIRQLERHGKESRFYMYDDVVFVADDHRLYTIIDKKHALPHIRHARAEKEFVFAKRQDFETAMADNHDAIDYQYFCDWDAHYDIYQASHGPYVDYVKVNRSNDSEKHRLNEQEYHTVDTHLMWNHIDNSYIEACIADKENLAILELDGQYIFHIYVHNASLHFSYDPIEKNVLLLEGDCLTKALIHIRAEEQKESLLNDQGLLNIGRVKICKFEKNFNILLDNTVEEEVSGRDFQTFQSIKRALKTSQSYYDDVYQWEDQMYAVDAEKGETLNRVFERLVGRIYQKKSQRTVFANISVNKDTILVSEKTPQDTVVYRTLHPSDIPGVTHLLTLSTHTLKEQSQLIGYVNDKTYYQYNIHDKTYSIEWDEIAQTMSVYGLKAFESPIIIESNKSFYAKWAENKRFEYVCGKSIEKIIVKATHIGGTQRKYFHSQNPFHYCYYNALTQQLQPVPLNEIEWIQDVKTECQLWASYLHDDLITVTLLEDDTIPNGDHIMAIYYMDQTYGPQCAYLINHQTLIYPPKEERLLDTPSFRS